MPNSLNYKGLIKVDTQLFKYYQYVYYTSNGKDKRVEYYYLDDDKEYMHNPGSPAMYRYINNKLCHS